MMFWPFANRGRKKKRNISTTPDFSWWRTVIILQIIFDDVIPMVYFYLDPTPFSRGFRLCFETSISLFLQYTFTFKINKTIVTIPYSASDGGFFFTRHIFSKHLFQFLVTMGCDSLLTRLQVLQQPRLHNNTNSRSRNNFL